MTLMFSVLFPCLGGLGVGYFIGKARTDWRINGGVRGYVRS